MSVFWHGTWCVIIESYLVSRCGLSLRLSGWHLRVC